MEIPLLLRWHLYIEIVPEHGQSGCVLVSLSSPLAALNANMHCQQGEWFHFHQVSWTIGPSSHVRHKYWTNFVETMVVYETAIHPKTSIICILKSTKVTLDISGSPIDFQWGSWKYPEYLDRYTYLLWPTYTNIINTTADSCYNTYFLHTTHNHNNVMTWKTCISGPLWG